MAWLDLGVSEGPLGAPRWDTRPLGSDRFELTVSGVLAGDWAARITARLARLDLSIISGHAIRDGMGFWTSHFEVKVSETRDYGKFADRTFLEFETPPEPSGSVERHTLVPSEAHGGTVELSVVEARDCVGFLAALLWSLREHALVPVELRIDTRDGRIFDKIWLEKAGGGRPSPDSCAALEGHLEELLSD